MKQCTALAWDLL